MRNKLSTGVVLLLVSTFFSQGASAARSTEWGSYDDNWSPPENRAQRKEVLQRSSRHQVSPFSPDSHNIAIDLGQIFLMGDLTQFSDSIGTRIHYTYGVSELFGFDSSIGFSEHSKGNFSMMSAVLGMRMNMSWYDKIIPYVIFGLGFYRPSYQDPSIPANSTAGDTSISGLLFGVHLGPGVDLQLSRRLFFGAGLTFHSVFGASRELSDGTEFNIGGTFVSFLLRLGVTF